MIKITKFIDFTKDFYTIDELNTLRDEVEESNIPWWRVITGYRIVTWNESIRIVVRKNTDKAYRYVLIAKPRDSNEWKGVACSMSEVNIKKRLVEFKDYDTNTHYRIAKAFVELRFTREYFSIRRLKYLELPSVEVFVIASKFNNEIEGINRVFQYEQAAKNYVRDSNMAGDLEIIKTETDDDFYKSINKKIKDDPLSFVYVLYSKRDPIHDEKAKILRAYANNDKAFKEKIRLNTHHRDIFSIIEVHYYNRQN